MRTAPFRATAALLLSLAFAPMVAAAEYGAPMPEGEATPVVQLLSGAEHHVGHRMKVTGRITQVCQAKGCWLMLDANGVGVRVKTGHDFFVPKDASGTAVVFGEWKAVELSPEQARHYVEDGSGESTPGREWQILATSIVIEP